MREIKELLNNILETINRIININYQSNRQTELQEQMLRRLDYQNRQLELTNNLLLEMIQCSDREELYERVQVLMGRGY